jgi:Flp pilus assembly protein TadG
VHAAQQEVHAAQQAAHAAQQAAHAAQQEVLGKQTKLEEAKRHQTATQHNANEARWMLATAHTSFLYAEKDHDVLLE